MAQVSVLLVPLGLGRSGASSKGVKFGLQFFVWLFEIFFFLLCYTSLPLDADLGETMSYAQKEILNRGNDLWRCNT